MAKAGKQVLYISVLKETDLRRSTRRRDLQLLLREDEKGTVTHQATFNLRIKMSVMLKLQVTGTVQLNI